MGTFDQAFARSILRGGHQSVVESRPGSMSYLTTARLLLSANTHIGLFDWQPGILDERLVFHDIWILVSQLPTHDLDLRESAKNEAVLLLASQSPQNSSPQCELSDVLISFCDLAELVRL